MSEKLPESKEPKDSKNSVEADGTKKKSFRYKAGDSLYCKVIAKEENGYGLEITNEVYEGFIFTTEKLEIGATIIGGFVCIAGGRILVSSRFNSKDNVQQRPS